MKSLQCYEVHYHLSHMPSTNSNQMLVLPSEIDTSLTRMRNTEQEDVCVTWYCELNKSSLKVDAYGGCLAKMKAILMLLFPVLLYSTFKLPWFIETFKVITQQSVIFTWQDNYSSD